MHFACWSLSPCPWWRHVSSRRVSLLQGAEVLQCGCGLYPSHSCVSKCLCRRPLDRYDGVTQLHLCCSLGPYSLTECLAWIWLGLIEACIQATYTGGLWRSLHLSPGMRLHGEASTRLQNSSLLAQACMRLEWTSTGASTSGSLCTALIQSGLA